jgi:hypothetical protein
LTQTSSPNLLLQGLLVWNPFRTVRADPQSLLESLVNAGHNLGGNSCPANATNPLQGCPPGSYCPTPDEVVLCPIGHYWCDVPFVCLFIVPYVILYME